MRKDAQLHHQWGKIPTEIMSNLILVYSVMANEAINKGDFFLGVGSAVQQTWVSLKSKIQILYWLLHSQYCHGAPLLPELWGAMGAPVKCHSPRQQFQVVIAGFFEKSACL